MKKLLIIALFLAPFLGISQTDVNVFLEFQKGTINCGPITEVCYDAFVSTDAAGEALNLTVEGMTVRLVYDDGVLDLGGSAAVTVTNPTEYQVNTSGFSEAVSGLGSVFNFDGNAVFYSTGIELNPSGTTPDPLTTTPTQLFTICLMTTGSIDPTMMNTCVPLLWDQSSDTTPAMGDGSVDSWQLNNSVNLLISGAGTNAIETVDHFAWNRNATPYPTDPVDIVPNGPYGDPAIPNSGECLAVCSLPVELAGFDAELVGDDGYLTWRTASEDDNSHFDIERSTDGINFQKIGEVAGAGTTDVAQSYSFTDLNIVGLGEEELFYRLKQNDFAGTFDYSEIEIVNISGDERLDVISVSYGTNYRLKQNFGTGIERVDIYSPNGQLLSSREYGGQDIVELETDGLAGGVYMLVINGKDTKRLVIVR